MNDNGSTPNGGKPRDLAHPTVGALEVLRAEVNELDDRLFELLRSRAQAALAISRFKRANGLPQLDKDREGEIMGRLLSYTSSPFDAEAVRRLFGAVLTECRHLADSDAASALARTAHPR